MSRNKPIPSRGAKIIDDHQRIKEVAGASLDSFKNTNEQYEIALNQTVIGAWNYQSGAHEERIEAVREALQMLGFIPYLGRASRKSYSNSNPGDLVMRESNGFLQQIGKSNV